MHTGHPRTDRLFCDTVCQAGQNRSHDPMDQKNRPRDPDHIHCRDRRPCCRYDNTPQRQILADSGGRDRSCLLCQRISKM